MIRYVLIAALACAAPAAAQTQRDMTATAIRQFQSADTAMTRQWQRTYAYMKGRDAQDTSRGGGFGYAASTLASQRAWLAFRDTQCVIEGGQYAGGSVEPLARIQCRTRMTRERTTQLANLLWTNR